jgi:amino acid transporter
VLRVLILGGVAALHSSVPIGILISVLLAIVAFSYRQTIHACPSGGGATSLRRKHRTACSLTAAASLFIDYTLTVAVSVAAGVAAVTSAIPALLPYRVELTLAFVLVLMVGNLRGVRESGRIFSVPTYFFIGSILALIAVGVWRYTIGTVEPVIVPDPLHQTVETLSLHAADGVLQWLLRDDRRQAVSNGVPAFRPPNPSMLHRPSS